MSRTPPEHGKFKKGQSGNPGGRPKLPPDIRKASALNSVEFIRVATQFLKMTRGDIQKALSNPAASMMELLIGGIVAKAAKDHDYLRANFLFDRTIGKAPDTIRHGFETRSLHEQLVDAIEKHRREE